MRRKNIWKPDFDVIAELIQEYPGGVEAFVQKTFPKMGKNIWKLYPNTIMELIQEFPGGIEAFIQKALELVKTKEQRRKLIELIQQDGGEIKE